MTCPYGHEAPYCGITTQGKRMMACNKCGTWYIEGEKLKPEVKVKPIKRKRTK